MVDVLELSGVFVFAISGALAACQFRMNLFGVLVLSVVTAIGGGTLRDLLTNVPTIFWVDDPTYVLVALIGGIFTIIVARSWTIPPTGLLVADAFGLSLFCVLGAQQALGAGTSAAIAIVMGVLSAVAGGVIRDIFSSTIPLIFQREIYAMAAVLGASTFVVLVEAGSGRNLSMILGILAAFTLRLIAIRWGLTLTVVSAEEPPR